MAPMRPKGDPYGGNETVELKKKASKHLGTQSRGEKIPESSHNYQMGVLHGIQKAVCYAKF